MSSHTLPVVAGDKDRSLQEVLSRLTASRAPLGAEADPIVTAAHRMPAIAGVVCPISRRNRPAALRGACVRAGSSSSTRIRPKPSRTRSPAATWSPSRRPPRARRSATTRRSSTRSSRIRRRARCICFRRKRSRRISSPSCTRWRSCVDARQAIGEIGVFTYDGDTPPDARRAIRGKAHVVLSNPDMLHSGILPHHPRWAKLFENLQFVVIDELHAYRGVFGSHLANILRRLRRVCRHYGSDPHLHLLVGDDRQPARAGGRADGPRRSSWSIGAARRAARSSSCSSIRRSSTRNWASGARIWPNRGGSRSSSSSTICS